MGDFSPGELYFSTRGIVEIQDFYQENGLEKIRCWVHMVDKADGVTATGDVILMSTTPDILQGWIAAFPRDLAERRQGVAAKGFHDILARIDQAKAEGPKVAAKRNDFV